MAASVWVPACTAAMPAITSLMPPLRNTTSLAPKLPLAKKVSICSVMVGVLALPAASGLIFTRALPTA